MILGRVLLVYAERHARVGLKEPETPLMEPSRVAGAVRIPLARALYYVGTELADVLLRWACNQFTLSNQV